MAENMVNMVILRVKDNSIFLNILITSYQKNWGTTTTKQNTTY